MKAIWILILALCLSGCGAAAPEPTAAPTQTQAVTETTQPPTETTAPTEPAWPESMEVTVEEKPVTMDLFDGGGYVIYLPREEWTVESEVTEGYLTDRFTNADNSSMTMEVITCGAMSAEAVEKRILVTEGNYHFGPEENGGYKGLDNVRGRYMIFTIVSDGAVSYALTAEYPTGQDRNFVPVVRAVMDAFAIK